MGKKSTRLILISGAILFVAFVVIFMSVGNDKKTEIAPDAGEKALFSAREKIPEKENVKSSVKDKTSEVQGSEVQGKDSDWKESVLKALNDPNTAVRLQAVLSLRKHPSEEAIHLLSRFLKDKDITVVSEVIDTLGFIGLTSGLTDMVYDILEEKAKDTGFPARGQALLSAAMLGKDDRILSVISEYISEKDDQGKLFAVRALSFIANEECIPQLRRLLDECEDPELHRNAYHILAKIDTPEALDLLQKYMGSSDEDTQANSAWALSRENKEEFNQVLEEAVANRNLGKKAISVLAKSPSAPEVFAKVLQRDDVEKEDKISWMKILAENTINAPSEVRQGIVSAVEPLLNSQDPDLERQAIETLGKIGGGEETAEILAPKLESESFLVREEALYAYAQYCSPKTYKPLIGLWYDKDEKVRRTAFFLSSTFLNDADRPELEKALNHEDEFIAEHAGLILNQVLRKL